MTKVSFSEPFQKFAEFFKQAGDHKNIVEPTAMCLSTVDENNAPSSRMILLKKFDETGFCFFTNSNSRKGHELSKNNKVALCFYWGVLGLQIRIEGVAQKVLEQESDEYFASRRRESQIGAWASKQSSEMQNWEEFEERIAKVTADFAGKEMTRPPFWYGFRVVPTKIEFWQEGDFRIHKRERYERSGDSWIVKKLYP